MDSSYINNIQDPIVRAEAMRAQAISQMLTDAFDGLRDLVKSATRKLSAYVEYRRNYDTLSAMTDRELDDIGITRGDIPAVARGFDPRQVQVELPAKSALAQRLAVAAAFDKEAVTEAPANQDHRGTAAAA